MLTPIELELFPYRISQHYQQLNDDILAEIAERTASTTKITSSIKFLKQVQHDISSMEKDFSNEVKKVNKVANEEIDKLYKELITTSNQRDVINLGKSLDSYNMSPIMNNKLKTSIINAQEDVNNLTQSMGFAYKGSAGVEYAELRDFYTSTLNQAHLEVISGYKTYNEATYTACKKLADSGVRTIFYESGVSRSIEAATRTSILTTLKNTNNIMTEANARLLGADGMEISAHAQPRPSHEDMQGGQYSMEEYINDIEPLLYELNCRHTAFPIFLGLTTPVFNEDELEELKEVGSITYKGKERTGYWCTQHQREIERKIRSTKNELITYKNAGLQEKFLQASFKLKQQEKEYRDFSKEAGLLTQNERLRVVDFNKSISQEAVWAYRKAS